MFENRYFYKDVTALFPTFYEANIKRINLRDPTLTIQKDIDICKSREDQIETIEK
jgi:hypothetical protein